MDKNKFIEKKNMKLKAIWASAFDKHHKLEYPSGDFSWMKYAGIFKKIQKEVVCEGYLQELEESTSALYPSKYYIATSTRIYRCIVRLHVCIIRTKIICSLTPF